MRTPLLAALALASVSALPLPSSAQPAKPAAGTAPAASTSVLAWPEITREAKPWTRWWWMGSAVDKENLSRELASFAAAGLGGVEITPIYGARGYEDRFIPFLSPKYIEMLGHTASEAKRLGLAVDMATGTGWPFGGAQTPPADAELKVEIKDGKFATRATNFKVKRAAPGAEGLVLDPYSAPAIERYLEFFTKTLATLPAGAIHGHFHDSFEYTANWTPTLPEKFKSMHGYDLADHTAELSGTGDPDTIARIKSDYRLTIGELHMEYMRAWGKWVRAQGGVVRNQGHGAPSNLLDLYALADIPETEVFGSTKFPIPGFRHTAGETSYNETQPLVNRFASSAAHVAGHKLTSSETFTWLREHFHEAPSEMKPELDQLFLTGINHVFYHGTAYSPADAPWPGWLFYASTQYHNRNPLWRDINEGLNAYIARAQSLLQSGQPDNDILVYWPFHDVIHNREGLERKFSMHGKDWLTDSSTGKIAQTLVDRGFSFDFASDAQIQSAKIDGSEIKTTGGSSYRVILVPKTQLMPVETLRHLIDLAEQGAQVLFYVSLPADVPGLSNLAERRAQFAAQLARVKLNPSSAASQEAPIGKGRFLTNYGVEVLLQLAGVRADTNVAEGLGVLRRRLSDGHLYFVTNPSSKSVNSSVELSRSALSAALFDARNGTVGVAQSEQGVHSVTTITNHNAKPPTTVERATLDVRLQLAPGESIFVRTFTGKAPAGPAWKYIDAAGAPVALTGDWRVTFLNGGPALPPAFTAPAPKLASWTEQSPEHERFAGTSRYELSFDLPATPAGAADWLLDLGDVRETARVFVNGTEVDLLWSLPFRTRIDAKHLKAGRNTLALEVTNLASNRVRDMDKAGVKWANFYDANVVNVNYKKMDAAAWPVMPSGLLGPVTLTPLKK